MFEGGDTMSEPRRDMDDDIERLLAAEEAAIADEGFSARVVEATQKSGANRRLTLYGAGMAGFGIAAGSISEAAARSPTLSMWASEAKEFLDAPIIPSAFSIGDVGLIAVAGAVGLIFSAIALIAQAR
jgi:hypothetical protein